MQHLPIWYMGQIDHAKCDELINEYSNKANSKAAMGIEGDKIDDGYRNTNVIFLPENHKFGIEMMSTCFIANKECSWDFNIESHEAIQFAKYGPEQHYNWHTDTFLLSGKNYDRKVTVVTLLNDPSEFSGGQFQIRLYAEYTAPLVKGSVIAFPSMLEHRVTPITDGIRYSATLWMNGPRFK